MKLDSSQYFENGHIFVTEKGWLDLYKFCQSILYKNYGTKFSKDVQEDLTSICLLSCIDNLEKYNAEKNDELGGFLYWKVRGEVTKYMQKVIKEVATDMREDGFIEWMEAEYAEGRLSKNDIR